MAKAIYYFNKEIEVCQKNVTDDMIQYEGDIPLFYC